MEIANVEFDLCAEYMEQVSPLVQELHKKCISLGIPFYFVACHTNNESDYRVAQAMHLKRATTPIQLFAAEVCGDGRAHPLALKLLFEAQVKESESSE